MSKQIFSLVVVRPVTGHRGKIIFERTVYASSVSEAVKEVRKEVEGSGLVVLQAASYHSESKFGTMGEAMLDAYQRATA